MNEIISLYKAFNHIKYVDQDHKYICNNEFYTSVTGLLGSLKTPFDTQFWRVYKSLEYSGYKVKDNRNGTIIVNSETTINPYFNDLSEFILTVTPDDITKQWALTNKLGKTRGSALHNMLEDKLKRKELSYEIPFFVKYMSTLETIKYIKSIEILENLANEFVKLIQNKYVVIAQEFVVGDSDYKLAGTFDLLLFNLETNKYELWDFKTDKKFDKSGLNKISYFGVDDCEYNKYSLQLGLYKHMIEKNTDLQIYKCVVAHFNYKKNEFKIIDCINYDDEIKQYLTDGYNKPTCF